MVARRAARGDHAIYHEALTLWHHLRVPHRATQITKALAGLEIK